VIRGEEIITHLHAGDPLMGKRGGDAMVKPRHRVMCLAEEGESVRAKQLNITKHKVVVVTQGAELSSIY